MIQDYKPSLDDFCFKSFLRRRIGGVKIVRQGRRDFAVFFSGEGVLNICDETKASEGSEIYGGNED